MARPLHQFLIFLLVTTFVVACAPQVEEEPPRAPTLAGSLHPWHSPTPSAIPPTATPIPTVTPLPTATPQLYIVQSGDTMGSIALELGLDMGDLGNANPDISPSAMSVGQEIVIPAKEADEEKPVEMMPLKVALNPLNCYPTLSGGTWCFVLVTNNEDLAVESLAAKISLFGEENMLLAAEVAYAFLDRLPAGERFPLAVYFPDVTAFHHAEVALVSGFSVSGAGGQLPVSLQRVLTEIAWDGHSATVRGDVVVEGDASQVWILATAYDEQGNVVGVRRWEGVGAVSSFDVTLASLGLAIDHVSLLAEAKP